MRREATDCLWDCSPRAMAERFGALALGRLRAGRDPLESARLAFSYARLALDDEEADRVMLFPLRTGSST